MVRPIKVRVSRRRGITCPEALARALSDYLLGRTNTRPTIRYNRKEAA